MEKNWFLKQNSSTKYCLLLRLASIEGIIIYTVRGSYYNPSQIGYKNLYLTGKEYYITDHYIFWTGKHNK